MSKTILQKLPSSVIVSASVVITFCCLGIILIFIASTFPLIQSVPTSSVNMNNTAVMQTLITINRQTLAAQSPTPANTATELPTETQTPFPTATSQLAVVPGTSCIPNNSPQTGEVVDVVDGDTIKVILDQDGKTYSVRYIGMDTPENTSQVEYFGLEAAAKNSELVSGKNVTLIKDVSETDRYDRLLRYVIVDSVFVNYELVAQGYADTVGYPPDTSCIPTFQAAQQKAMASKLGYWAVPTPTSSPLPIFVPHPTKAPTKATSGSSGGSSGNAPCSCGGNHYNCSDFGTHSSAQACYNYCKSIGRGDVHRLDGDNDGSACESLP